MLLLTIAATCSLDAGAKSLPRSAPEAQGVASAALVAFIDEVEAKKLGLHSLMVLRHGQVVAQGWWKPYDAAAKHELYSLSKSFTSTAVGLAIDEGKLSLDDEALKRFPKDAPPSPAANLKNMRLRDLLCMSTGHQAEPRLLQTATEPWTKTFLAAPVAFKPGTHFLYNTPATYMQSAMVQAATGQTVLDFLTPRLFEPLGIEGATWGNSPQGVSLGGYGLSLRTEDIAKFGQLLLQKGEWRGKQIVPAAWIAAATARQTSNGSNPKSDWDQGYGYQFWRSRHGAFRGDGAFGQFCIVLPEQDAVVAITAGTPNLQGVLDAVWGTILPALKSAPLPDDPAAAKQLADRLAALEIPFPRPAEAAVGELPPARTYRFPANAVKLNSAKLETASDRGVAITLAMSDGPEQRFAAGLKEWQPGMLAWGPPPAAPVACRGVWTSPRQFVATVCFRETPFVQTLTFDFAEGKLKVQAQPNVAFGGAKPMTAVGEPLPAP